MRLSNIPKSLRLIRESATVSTPLSCRCFSSSPKQSTAWGFIGLGAMGYPMAKNLRTKIPASDLLTIYDVNSSATAKFVEEVGVAASSTDAPEKGTGIQIATGPRGVAEKSEIIITVLPEPQHVKGVFGTILKDKLPSLPTTRLFIDCSTIDPSSSQEVAATVSSSGSGNFVDAPMSGGVVGARAGSLTFMIGADPSLVKDVEFILLTMGKKVWHLGEQGAGLSGKLANNYALAINNIAAAEAMNLGIRWGLDPKALTDLINSSTGRSWPSEVNNPVPGVVETAPASRGYEGGFGISLMKKDLKLAVTAAEEAGARLELAEKAREVYESAEKEHKGKDFSVIYKYIGGTK